MSTLRHLIYSIKESLRQYSDDSDLSNEYLAYLINNGRALLISQRYSSRQFAVPNKIRSHFYKELELAEDNEFVTGMDTVLRTKEPIHPIIEHFNLMTDIRITSGSYSDNQFMLVNAARFPYVGSNKWVQNQIYVCIGTDWRLYFKSSNSAFKIIDNVKLSYVVENPETSYSETIDYDSSVDFWDVEYPLEESMVTPLVDMIIKKLIVMLQMPEDTNNDSSSEKP